MDPILKAQENIEQARAQLAAAVREARAAGRTWADIGAVLGISRQAAFKRFGEVTNPADGRVIKGAPVSITAIQELTERVFELISQAKYAQLDDLLHPDVRDELNAETIGGVWAEVLTEVGAKESCADTHVVLPAGDRIDDDADILGVVVGVTTLRHEAGEMMGRVAVDQDQRIVGLLIVAPDAAPLPF